jgi:hypothetical protein
MREDMESHKMKRLHVKKKKKKKRETAKKR